MTRAAFLGRFQPMHRGHQKVIREYSQEYEEFLIVIGSASKKREEENPLDLEERKKIISECFPKIEMTAKQDQQDDQEWAEKLEEKTGADIIISGNSLVQRLVEEHTSMELVKQELYDPEIYSGSEVRRRIRSGEEWRYLIPKCAKENIEGLEEVIKKSGIQYEFKPGWKKENAYHETSGE